VILGRESSRILALEPSWHDDVIVAAPPLLDVVAAFGEELPGRVVAGAGPERDLV
jgi:hypothetical protein